MINQIDCFANGKVFIRESSEMTTMFDIVLNDHSSILSSSLYCLQQNGFMCDTKLQGIDGHVLVHGIVLSVTSLYFKGIIEKSSQDAKNIKLINLETENVSVINLFVELLYTGKVICSEQNVKKIINLIKLYKIENVCYYCKKEKPTAIISEDNVNSMSEIESPFGEITDTENMETVEGSDCGFLAHSKESPSGSSDKSGQNNPVKTLVDKRNSLPGNVRKTSTRKRKLNPKYFNESSQTLRKADTQNKKQLKNYFNENNESGVSSASEKSKTANDDISSVEKVMTRNEGQRSNIGYEIDQKEESVSSKNQPANAVKNEPRNNKQQVKQNQSTKTMQQKNIKVEPNKIQDVVISDRNKDTGSKKTMDKEYIQSVSTGLTNNAEKDKNENKCPDDVKQESKGKRTRIESQNLLAKLGLIATKENSVAEENTMILECEIGLSDPESENDGDVKKIGRSRNNCLDKPKKCWKCGKMSENYEEYLKHRQEKHPLYVAKLAIKNQKLKGKQRNYCQMCDLNFDCYKSFLQHRKEVKHVRKNHRTVYNCNYCEYTTKVECYLDMHKIKKHNMDLSETDFEIFRCPAKGCDYFNLRKSILEAHVANAHDTEHIEVCEICGKTMKTRKQLQQHVKMHIPVEQRVKKYECPECDKKFTRRTDFTLHFNHKHKNEKPFMCHLCPYRVTSQRLLDIHLYNHHDQPLPSYIKQ
ncbi:hypothetical protein KUTeg_009668 [Tegillarca granosa]|uniref:Uncharacterized protein n=1 Tax=Tegillarca granosa TaxID=220873 RepID=A0ABQ9F7N8_TEGGR|nr:hypothetical protein KUTeg_009668 [Tegillarca granosa]